MGKIEHNNYVLLKTSKKNWNVFYVMQFSPNKQHYSMIGLTIIIYFYFKWYTSPNLLKGYESGSV